MNKIIYANFQILKILKSKRDLKQNNIKILIQKNIVN